MKTHLILIADPHVGKPNNLGALNHIIQHIITSHDATTTAVAFLGDLMDNPTYVNAIAVGESLRRLTFNGFDVLAVPGNHDLYENGLDVGFGFECDPRPWQLYIEPHLAWTNKQYPRIYRTGDLQIVGLDTMAGVVDNFEIDLAQGCVGKTQRTRLMLALQDGPSLVIGHHRVMWRDPAHLLEDAAEIERALSGQSWGYASGHQHKSHRVDMGGVIYHNCRRTTQRQGGGFLYDVLELVEGLPYQTNKC